MAFEFKLPDIGEGVVEGELTKWLVEAGQAVVEDTPLFEVLTDKVSAVIPSPRKGIVTKRHFAEGDMVPVGAIVVTIEESGAAVVAPVVAAAVAPVAAAAPVAAVVAVAAAPAREPGERVRAAPATRKLARDLGVDLQVVAGSGEHGRVTKSDIEALANQIASAPTGAPAKAAVPKAPMAATALVRGPDEERIKLKGLRRKIYAKMRESKDHAAHFTYVDEIDFTAIIALQDALAQNGVKSTFLPFVVKAVVLSLQKPEFAYLNAQIDEAAGEIVLKKRYHIGVAAATEAGLVVPVVRDADQKSIRQLIEEIRRVGEGARTFGSIGFF